VRTLRLYQDALRLFRAWRLPLLSLLDTPGVDPRIDNSNQDVIQQLIETNRAIIHYPYPKMGVWSGRGFGGANTLVIPRCYGSFANYVILDRTRVGVMHESIISHLLEKSKRLLSLWQASRVTETEDFQDLVDAGIATRAIRLEEMGTVVSAFLRGDIASPLPASPVPDDTEVEICA
jgi:acetyl-CoA carboxylase carboxyltransferase component